MTPLKNFGKPVGPPLTRTHSLSTFLLMGKPYNAILKKRRRLRYLKRKKIKAKAAAKTPKPAAG